MIIEIEIKLNRNRNKKKLTLLTGLLGINNEDEPFKAVAKAAIGKEQLELTNDGGGCTTFLGYAFNRLEIGPT